VKGRDKMEDEIDEIEEFKKKVQEEEKKKKKRKRILIFLLIVILFIGMYFSTVIVKKINVSKLGNEYCEYNGEHPIETGMKSETHSTCRGCSKIMKFEYKITNELCDTCAEELHRCKLCGNLLED
jgi:hypothetical protein